MLNGPRALIFMSAFPPQEPAGPEGFRETLSLVLCLYRLPLTEIEFHGRR